MANNKMLIDASHPEETRVVVVRGNRIEEFDFEAQDRRQLRGNIYLAKVTRVEPSLQAAFIDYGGNRHGFLAFSEIHPDYYQIPAADRQALLDAEAEAASGEDDENSVGIEEAASSGNEEEGDEDEAPKKRKRKPRRGGRNRKSRDEQEAAADDNGEADASADAADNNDDAADASDDAPVEAEETEEKPKPKKRTRRPRKKKADEEVKAESEDDAAPADGDTDDSSDGAEGGSTTMAAMMDMDVISEDAPEDDSGDDNAEADAPAEEAAEEKPKRKPRAKKAPAGKSKKAEAKDEAAGSEAAAEEETATEEKPKKRTRRKPAAKKKAAADEEAVAEDTGKTSGEESTDEASAEADASEAEAAKPTKRRNRRKTKTEAADEGAENGNGENGDQTDENGKSVESVGQEDALEEVSVKRPRRQYKIQEVIRRRQVMLVQVVKEERGNKGAALTTYLSLAGRYSVLMPNTARGGGISRKITNPGDRKRLKEIASSLDVPAGMGVILRTAGASREKEEIQRDFDYLMRLWENVRDLTLESSAPFLVYEEGSLIKRSIRDLYNKDIGEIIVAGETGYREAKDFMRMLMPGHGRNVKLYKGEQSLLSKYSVESQLDKMVAPQVTLKSGGYLIINQTEALVAIDVNSGKSTREHSIEATALQTNLEAAEEVARQLRLRDLAGLVVIDFIDMEEKRNNRAVERKLKECLKDDRARIQVGHISHFGLLEMSRQRIRASVLESTMAICPTCQGTGHIRSEPSFALQILRALDDHLNRNSRNNVNVKIPASTAIYILNNKKAAVSELEDRYGVSITFEADPSIEGQDFNIERGEPSNRRPRRKEAVNPMDLEMDAAPAVEEDEDTEASEEDNGRGKRQRGRGRGRGRGRNKDRDQQETAPADSEEEVTAEASQEKSAEAAEATDEQPAAEKPKRGRRKRAAAKDAEPDALEQPKVAETTADAADEPEEPKAPRRRTGRPGKVMRTPEEIAEAEERKKAESAELKERNGAPRREVERRNTRRVPRKEVEDGDDSEPSSWSGGFLG